MVKFTIDGRIVEIEEGKTVLDAAKKLDIYIPTLCYHPALEPYGACRLCLVEVTKESWKGWSKLVVSCAYPVEENIIVSTASEKATKSRKFVMQLLLARCPESQVIRDLAGKLDVQLPAINTNSSQTERLKDCILCGLCARICSDLVGQKAISFTKRGINRMVDTAFQKNSENCIGCSACVFVCPTNAVKYIDTKNIRKMLTWNTEIKMNKCTMCGKEFITDKQLAVLKNSSKLVQDIINVCPDCRQKQLMSNIPIYKI